MHPHRRTHISNGRSFWFGAANYYVMAAAFAIAVFFIAFGLLRESDDQPFIPAGVAASAVLLAAVILRRAVLLKAQRRALALRQLDQTWRPVSLNAAGGHENKLTIEKNAAILNEIKRKSEAAMLLAKYSDGHREVYQLCGQYLELNQREMRTVGVGSPRIAALRRGREVAEEYHRLHMLKWAEVEARSLLDNARSRKKAADKIETANQALAAVDSALGYYPAENMLSESVVAISEFILMVKVADLMERGGRSFSRGNRKQAERHYKNALSKLGDWSSLGGDRVLIAARIQEELKRLEGPEK